MNPRILRQHLQELKKKKVQNFATLKKFGRNARKAVLCGPHNGKLTQSVKYFTKT